jgi:hypothetical protein
LGEKKCLRERGLSASFFDIIIIFGQLQKKSEININLVFFFSVFETKKNILLLFLMMMIS